MDEKQRFDDFFNRYYKDKKGEDFEKWFAKMASYALGADFCTVKPGGTDGDMKCDGYNAATGTVYQCYAPEGGKGNFLAKIRDSFLDDKLKVTDYWKNTKEWCFVTNSGQGLGAKAIQQIYELEKEYPSIKFTNMSREQLKAQFHDKFSLTQLRDVYPEYLGRINSPGMEDVIPLLKNILAKAPSSLGYDTPQELKIPKKTKLDFNKFSESNKMLLKRGMVNIHLVRDYIAGFSKPDYATKNQVTIIEEYKKLSALWAGNADSILEALFKWIRHEDTSRERSAAEVIIAYFFDSCDIYENPPETEGGCN